MTELEADFQTKCYELLFERNAEAQRHRWNFVQLSLVAIAAFYAFLLNPQNGTKILGDGNQLLWLPVPVCILGFLQAWGLRKGMIERGEVMNAIESAMNFQGWESVRNNMKGPSFVKSPLSSIAYVYWFCMSVLTAAIAIKAI